MANYTRNLDSLKLGDTIAVIWLVQLGLLEAELVLLRGGAFGDLATITGALYDSTVGMALVAKLIAVILAIISLYTIATLVREETLFIHSVTGIIASLALIHTAFTVFPPANYGTIVLYIVVISMTLLSSLQLLLHLLY